MGFTGILFFWREGWLLSWVVAATPGGAAFVLGMAVDCRGRRLASLCSPPWAGRPAGMALWLPAGRHLPDIWHGRWSGNLATAGSLLGAMMLGRATFVGHGLLAAFTIAVADFVPAAGIWIDV